MSASLFHRIASSRCSDEFQTVSKLRCNDGTKASNVSVIHKSSLCPSLTDNRDKDQLRAADTLTDTLRTVSGRGASWATAETNQDKGKKNEHKTPETGGNRETWSWRPGSRSFHCVQFSICLPKLLCNDHRVMCRFEGRIND